jgi:hypothetical protein
MFLALSFKVKAALAAETSATTKLEERMQAMGTVLF